MCLPITLESIWEALGKHLEEIHVTWAQFGKKHDMNKTLQNFDEALVYRSWRRRNKDFHLRSSVFQGDDVTRFCDDVKVADIKKP
ncbi:hypothetical protein Tco_1525574 [Tanacetum coccineum]